jgi:hypothetical protein
MGLEAVVFCDCVEKGRLKIPHPFPRLLYIAPNGSPEIRSEDPEKVEKHDEWMHQACKHPEMMIAGSHLGNITGIEMLRKILQAAVRAPAREFPVLWHKVIYCGTHTGDHLTLANVLRLQDELKRFRKIDFSRHCTRKTDLKLVDEFQSNLSRIAKVAAKINKPVAF